MLIQICNQNARLHESIIGQTNTQILSSKQGLAKISFFQNSFDMIYYSLDPQFATLLFSVYSRNERTSFSVLPDAFNFSTSIPSSGSVLSYAQTVGLQLIALGEHYAKVFSQVRAGSVIFLVGVGSLVCWKIWDYMNSSDAIDPRHGGSAQSSPSSKTPSGKSVSKSSTKSPKAFLASFLEEEFVHDFEEFEDEDPALIQGKYFGPESPVEHNPKYLDENSTKTINGPGQVLTEHSTPERLYPGDYSPLISEYSGKTDSLKTDIVDTSTAYLADDDDGSGTSDYEDSLPLDPSSHPSWKETKRLKKRLHNKRLERSQEKSSTKNNSKTNQLPGSNSELSCVLLASNSSSTVLNSFEMENSSSETSPRDRKGFNGKTIGHPSRLSSYYQNSRGRELNKNNKENLKHANSSRSSSASTKPYFYANCNSDDEWGIEERDEDDEVDNVRKNSLRKRSLSRDLSLSDLIGRLRKRNSVRSLSRDNSVSSRMSDFLRRDDSICSNLSDFAFSECSEISLELSIKDESIADQTITSLADIEDELNTLKSSVIEMDEEFLRFASKPNPYLIRTTYTDYSLDSSESRPESSLDNYRKIRSRSSSIVNEGENDLNLYRSNSVASLTKNALPRDYIDRESRKSVDSSHPEETDSSLKDWTPSKKLRISRRRSSTEAPAKMASQDDVLPSLEWDNGFFKQYEDEIKRREAESQYNVGEHHLDSILEIEGIDKYKMECKRHKFLPDHSSLELDLEQELQSSEDLHPTFSGRDILSSTLSPCISPSSSVVPSVPEDSLLHSMTVKEIKKSLPPKRQPPTSLPLRPSTEMPCNHMTASIDSAIQSAPGSRSGSSSPISHMTQSMMRYESGGFGFNKSAEAEQKLKKLFDEINQLLFNSNFDCCNPTTNHELDIHKKSFQDVVGSSKTKDQFRECLSKSLDCDPCEKCKKTILRLDVLRKQNQFLFAQTPVNGIDTNGQKTINRNFQHQVNDKNCSQLLKHTASVNRDSAIDLEWPTNP